MTKGTILAIIEMIEEISLEVNYQRNNYNGGNYNRGYNNSGPRENNWGAWNGQGNRGHQQRLFDHTTGRYQNHNNVYLDRRENYNNYQPNWRNRGYGGYGKQGQNGNLNYQGAHDEPRMTSQHQSQGQNQERYQNQSQNQGQPRSTK